MGPAELVPDFPEHEWTRVPPGHALVHRWLQRSNWAQGMEGKIDSAHISFLHKRNTPRDGGGAAAATEDPAPVLTLRETDCGFVYGSRRKFEDRYYWRVSQWLAPMFSCIPGQPIGPFSGHGRAWVPVDDYNTTTFAYRYNPDRPYTSDEIAEIESGWFFPPRIERGVFDLPHGYRIDTYLPVACKENDYLIDRRMQKAENFTGIWGVNEQDRALQESTPSVPGAVGIADRSREHLVSSDVPVVTARRRLIRMARALREGVEPSPTRNARGYAVRAMSRFSTIAEFDDLLSAHGADCVAPASQDEAIA
jgi:phthalate 4,5-dioxygenase